MSSSMCLISASRRAESKIKMWSQEVYLESDSQGLEEDSWKVRQEGRKANKGFHCPGFLRGWAYKLSVLGAL